MDTLLFALVIEYARDNGITGDKLIKLFSAKNIRGGYQILEEADNLTKDKK
jgi:hypothetical protein